MRKSNRKNALGMKFNMLEVIDEFGTMTKNGIVKKTVGFHWVCVCDCGNLTVVAYSDLRRGRTKSCGCQQGPKRLPLGEPASNGVFFNVRGGAKDRGYSFNLSKEQVLELTSGNCHYCGCSPSREAKRQNHRYLYNGIDRVDNEKGYELENCVTCCASCNMMKSTHTIEQFKQKITELYIRMDSWGTFSTDDGEELEDA